VYTQRVNIRHHQVGHLFQGRYKAILVEKNEHLLELCRYSVLNPVWTWMVQEPDKWKWSSFPATAYAIKTLDFLTVDWILRQFAKNKNEARKIYRNFVGDGLLKQVQSPWNKLVGQIVFGSSDFVADIQSRLSEAKEIGEIPRAQRFPGRPTLGELFQKQEKQDKAAHNQRIEAAHIQYGYTLKKIADQLNIHYTTVSKVLKGYKR
jgi:putative transposase